MNNRRVGGAEIWATRRTIRFEAHIQRLAAREASAGSSKVGESPKAREKLATSAKPRLPVDSRAEMERDDERANSEHARSETTKRGDRLFCDRQSYLGVRWPPARGAVQTLRAPIDACRKRSSAFLTLYSRHEWNPRLSNVLNRAPVHANLFRAWLLPLALRIDLPFGLKVWQLAKDVLPITAMLPEG